MAKTIGPGTGGRIAAGRASPPSHRPTWLLVLSSITLIYGGLLLVSGLTALRDPSSAARFPVARPLPPEEEALTRQLMTVSAQIVEAHAAGIRGRAAASMVLALLMLYSAAAALSRDRRGRTVTLIAAWLGIVYQLGSLPVVIPIARDYAAASAPLLAQMMATQQSTAGATATSAPPLAAPPTDATAHAPGSVDETTGAVDADQAGAGTVTVAALDGAATGARDPAAPDDAAPRTEAVVGFMHTLFLGIPILTALLGILGSLLLIGYFGGRKGRALYGLEPPPRRR
jgi:hypothetical protein